MTFDDPDKRRIAQLEAQNKELRASNEMAAEHMERGRVYSARLEAELDALKAKRASHAGDCTIYSSLINGRPVDGICTCGYGWDLVGRGDWSGMYSRERTELEKQPFEGEPDEP